MYEPKLPYSDFQTIVTGVVTKFTNGCKRLSHLFDTDLIQ
jgi:hypothetical protein